MNIPELLKKRMEDRQISAYRLAELSGVPQPTITRILNGTTKNPRIETLAAIAPHLGIQNTLALLSADPANGKTLREGRDLSQNAQLRNAIPGPEIRKRVPVISRTAAGNFMEILDNYSPGEAEEWAYTTAKVGENAFALKIQGDSMQPQIPDGATVIVDPARDAVHRSIIIVKQPNHSEAVCKRLIVEGGATYLQPDNDRYPVLEIPEGAHIAGVVVQVIIDLA